jgi:hypothetical protein
LGKKAMVAFELKDFKMIGRKITSTLVDDIYRITDALVEKN